MRRTDNTIAKRKRPNNDLKKLYRDKAKYYSYTNSTKNRLLIRFCISRFIPMIHILTKSTIKSSQKPLWLVIFQNYVCHPPPPSSLNLRYKFSKNSKSKKKQFKNNNSNKKQNKIKQKRTKQNINKIKQKKNNKLNKASDWHFYLLWFRSRKSEDL